jgi:putative ABC transport system permease protein
LNLPHNMLTNYLLLAIRNILKQRGYAIVNALGLSIGLAAAIFILLYVRDELTFDTMHPKASNTYRMGYWLQFANGQEEKFPAVPAGWDNFIKDNYNGVTDIASYLQWGMPTSLYYEPSDKIILTEEIIWAEPSLRNLISIDIIKGDDATALKEPNNIILSETSAHKIFGHEDPLNKTISVSHGDMTNNKKVEMIVTGVYRDFPSNSHIAPQYIGNIYALKPYLTDLEKSLNEYMGEGQNGWWTQSYFTCENPEQIPVIQEALQKRANEIIERLKLDLKFKPIIRNITDVHFDKEIDWSVYHKSADKNYMYIFITIAVLILVMASINYINLAVAKSVTRAKEIGLRKTFGSQRVQLFFQFMLESFLLVMISVIVAVGLVILFLPQFNGLSEKTFEFRHLVEPGMLTIIAGVVIFVTILGGSYPAIFISGFEPATVLKGKFAFRKGSNVFRQFLIGTQFTVAVVLLIGSVILVRQMDLMRNSKLNEAGKQVISIRYGGFGEGQATDTQYNTFKNIVLGDPQIESMTLANHLPRLDYFGPINMQFQFPEVQEEKFEWFQLNGDYDFPKTFGLKIIAGRDFDPQNVSDSTAILLNESAVKALKLTPEEALNISVTRPAHSYYGGPDSTRKPVYGKVIGVVEDFPYKSMSHKIDPLGISGRPHFYDRIIHVRLDANEMGEKIRHLEQSWKKVFPGFGFDYWFIDDEFGRMYENETKIAGLTEKFSALAIIITCIGLYGLASFMAQQRTREIGIRKALGSSSSQIVILLLSVFGKLLLISSIIAIPVTYWLTSKWLERFVYQTPLSPWVFAGSLLLIALVTLATVGFETFRAARANPVKSLRHE